MKKEVTVAACGLFIMLAFVVSGITMYLDNKSTNDAPEPVAAVSKEVEKNGYILKTEDGVVVVYNEKDPTRPATVTDIYAGTLRNFDREALEKGVYAKDEYELLTMLEDYSS